MRFRGSSRRASESWSLSWRYGTDRKVYPPAPRIVCLRCNAVAEFFAAIAACGGDAREAVKTLLVAVDFLEAQVDELRAAVSTGYARLRYDVQRDRKE
jgi:hypothetical protein